MEVDSISGEKDGAEFYGASLYFSVKIGDRWVNVILMDPSWDTGDKCPEDTKALANKIRDYLIANGD
jgi:hypothetical protein